MKLRRLAPLASAFVLAGAVLPAAHAARPSPRAPSWHAAHVQRAVFRPTAHSIEVLLMRVDRLTH